MLMIQFRRERLSERVQGTQPPRTGHAGGFEGEVERGVPVLVGAAGAVGAAAGEEEGAHLEDHRLGGAGGLLREEGLAAAWGGW